MSTEIKVELIKLIPTILWIALVTGVIVVFYKPIKHELIPYITGINVFGLEATFVREQLDKVAQERPAGSPEDRSQVARRAERLAQIVDGAQILLVNDHPEEMQHVTQILRDLKIKVDVARTTEEALRQMNSRLYDLIISDMRRGSVQDEGQRFLDESIRRGINRPTIFTVGMFDPNRGMSPFAFGITNRVDELLNLVFDALERARG